MKKILAIVLTCMMCASFASVSFAQEGQKGASEKAREHASDQAIFNRVGDWFATIGKSDQEKQQIITERKAKREAKKAEKMAQKEAKKAEKAAKAKADEAEEEAEKAAGKMKKEAKGMEGKAKDMKKGMGLK